MGSEDIYIVFYGSLMNGLGGRQKIDIDSDVEFVMKCSVKGTMYDLGEFPGLLPEGDAIVKAELYRIINPEALEVMDIFEGFNIEKPELSLFKRELIKLDVEDIEAHIYYYNDSVIDAFEVFGGDWRTHIAARG